MRSALARESGADRQSAVPVRRLIYGPDGGGKTASIGRGCLRLLASQGRGHSGRDRQKVRELMSGEQYGSMTNVTVAERIEKTPQMSSASWSRVKGYDLPVSLVIAVERTTKSGVYQMQFELRNPLVPLILLYDVWNMFRYAFDL